MSKQEGHGGESLGKQVGEQRAVGKVVREGGAEVVRKGVCGRVVLKGVCGKGWVLGVWASSSSSCMGMKKLPECWQWRGW